MAILYFMRKTLLTVFSASNPGYRFSYRQSQVVAIIGIENETRVAKIIKLKLLGV